MSRVGLDWYKREPVAYLGDVQGLSAKAHAVYSVVIDLLYVHGGTINNDPKWIAGWISDMGAAAVRRALAELDADPRITLTVTEDAISQKRAKNEAKTKEKLRESARKSGEKGGKKSAENRAADKENSALAEATASDETQAEKIREEKSSVTNVTGDAADPDKVMFDHGRRLMMRAGKSSDAAGRILGKWRKQHGAALVIEALGAAQREGAIDLVSYCEGVFRFRRRHEPDDDGTQYTCMGTIPEVG